jgi:hypothetical protein
MTNVEELSRLWERMVFRDENGYRTVSAEIETIPIILVYHEKTLRFRVFFQGAYSRHDVTLILGEASHAECQRLVEQHARCVELSR